MPTNIDQIRIGIVLVNFPTPSETFIVTKILGLIDRGYDVHIFANRPSNYWDRFDILRERVDLRSRLVYGPPTGSLKKILIDGSFYLFRKFITYPTDFLRFVCFSWHNRNKNPYGFLYGFYLRSQYIGQKIDILHIEFDMQAVGIADIKEYLACKLIISVRSTIQKSRIYYKYPELKRWLFCYIDGCHFISQFLYKNTIDLGLNKSTPSWLIEPAIDLKLFNPISKYEAKRSDSCVHVLSVGRLHWTKGYEFAIDAIALVIKAGINVKYTILGEGDYRDAILFAAQQHGLLENGIVELVGAVPREHVYTYYTSSDIMLHAAIEEGFCNAVIEAQAMCIPVVSSDAGGLPENVENGVTGYIVPRRDPKALAEKLILLATDYELRERMGVNGRDRVMRQFALEDQIKKIIGMYQNIMIRSREAH